MIAILIAVTIVSLVCAQVIVKYGLHTLYFPQAFTAPELIMMVKNNLFNPFVIASLSCTLVAGLCWILIIQRMPLSKMYPLISLNYVMVYIAAWLLFHEAISVFSVFGIGLIVLGTILLGLR